MVLTVVITATASSIISWGEITLQDRAPALLKVKNVQRPHKRGDFAQRSCIFTCCFVIHSTTCLYHSSLSIANVSYCYVSFFVISLQAAVMLKYNLFPSQKAISAAANRRQFNCDIVSPSASMICINTASRLIVVSTDNSQARKVETVL